MLAKVEIIDVAYAKQLLEQNPANRRLTRTVVTRYAADMKAGRWENNGQGIIISPTGELLDGQHRMAAIVQAQTPISMLVVRGVPRNAFVTLDSGKPRSLGDVFGISGVAHPSIVAGVARVGFNYASGTHFNHQASKSEMAEFVQRHPYAIAAAELVSKKSRQFPKIPLAAVVFLGNAARAYDQEAAEFVEGVLFGQGLWKGDARLTLRDWIVTQRSKGNGTVRSFAIFAATIRAWNAYVTGRELLVIKGVAFPTRKTHPIEGFSEETFAVPDLAAKTVQRSRRSNLPRPLATPQFEAAQS